MDVVSQKRGKVVAIIGLVLQSAMTVVMLLVWMSTHSLAAMAGAWLLAIGNLLWIMTIVLFYCRQLEGREALELEEIAAAANAGGIFEQGQDLSLRPAANRTRWMMRWAVPAFTIIYALLVVMNLASQKVLDLLAGRTDLALTKIGFADPGNLTLSILGLIGMGFLGFLFGRYCMGLGSVLEYRPLRAAGSFISMCVLVVLAVAGVLAAASAKVFPLDVYVAYIIGAGQCVLFIELVLSLIMDIYRPRMPGQEQRLTYDSRLLNLLASPGKVGHSIAETLNYQFGFEVSKTWFYKLLSRALLPLLLICAFVLAGMSGIVLVPNGEKAVVLHLGKAKEEVLGPGLHLKWPWPIETVDRFNVSKVREIFLGAGDVRSADQLKLNYIKGREMQLWTQEHGRLQETDFLVAVPPRERAKEDKTPAVNIIKLVVSVQYLIDDVFKYGYKYENPEALLRCAAYREMVGYLASATLLEHVDDNPNRPQAIMIDGRKAAQEELERRIRKAVEDDLGVKVLHVAFQAVHPPSQAAPAYENVLKAQLGIEKARYDAEGNANRMLGSVAGDPAQALRLWLAIRRYQDLESMKDMPQDELLRTASDKLKQLRDELRKLQGEIKQDTLLGKDRAADDSSVGTSDKQDLSRRMKAYADMLETIQVEGRKFDFTAQLADADKQVTVLFNEAQGQPAAMVAAAKADRWKDEMRERARSEDFQREYHAYKQAPELYMLDRKLNVLDEVLPGVRKWVIGLPQNRYRLWMDQESDMGILDTNTAAESK